MTLTSLCSFVLKWPVNQWERRLLQEQDFRLGSISQSLVLRAGNVPIPPINHAKQGLGLGKVRLGGHATPFQKFSIFTLSTEPDLSSLAATKRTAFTMLVQPNTLFIHERVCSYAADSLRGTELEGIGERIGEWWACKWLQSNNDNGSDGKGTISSQVLSLSLLSLTVTSFLSLSPGWTSFPLSVFIQCFLRRGTVLTETPVCTDSQR